MALASCCVRQQGLSSLAAADRSRSLGEHEDHNERQHKRIWTRSAPFRRLYCRRCRCWQVAIANAIRDDRAAACVQDNASMRSVVASTAVLARRPALGSWTPGSRNAGIEFTVERMTEPTSLPVLGAVRLFPTEWRGIFLTRNPSWPRDGRQCAPEKSWVAKRVSDRENEWRGVVMRNDNTSLGQRPTK